MSPSNQDKKKQKKESITANSSLDLGPSDSGCMELGRITNAAGDLEAKALADSVEAEIARYLKPPSARKHTVKEHQDLEIEEEHESLDREAEEAYRLAPGEQSARPEVVACICNGHPILCRFWVCF